MDPRVINELLINDKFATAVRMIAMYFTNSVAKLIQSQNVLLDNSVSLLDGLVKDGKVPKDSDIAETAAFFHLTEKHMRLIEERSIAKLRAGMNDGKIL